MMALDGTNTPGRPLRTGSDGRFRANGLKTGAYKFFCNLSGSAKYPTSVSSPYVQATVTPGQSVNDVDFALEAGIPISGVVYDRDGRPAHRANVRAEARPSRAQEYASTSDDGTFTVYFPAPEQAVRLTAEFGDSASRPSGALSLPAEGLKNIDLTLSLSRTAALEGVVVQRDGRPAASYNVESQCGPWSNHCTTNADGTFSLKRLAPGAHTVTAWQGDWRTWNLKESAMEFTLEENKTLIGVTLLAATA